MPILVSNSACAFNELRPGLFAPASPSDPYLRQPATTPISRPA
jgi:hypothetical protein